MDLRIHIPGRKTDLSPLSLGPRWSKGHRKEAASLPPAPFLQACVILSVLLMRAVDSCPPGSEVFAAA